ncbi:MAG: transposase, partial [Chitinispirillaceae bacterium]
TRVKKYEEKIMKKGLEEGLEKGLEKTALKLIEKGMDNNFIHDVTGLSLEQIQSLREKHS